MFRNLKQQIESLKVFRRLKAFVKPFGNGTLLTSVSVFSSLLENYLLLKTQTWKHVIGEMSCHLNDWILYTYLLPILTYYLYLPITFKIRYLTTYL